MSCIPVAYWEEYDEKEVNNDCIFSVVTENPDNRLFLRLPNLDGLLKHTAKDKEYRLLTAACRFQQDIPPYARIFEGAQECVQLIVESITGRGNRYQFYIIEAGSAFEGLKVGEPWELDFMLCDTSDSGLDGITDHNGTVLEGLYKNRIVQEIYNHINNIVFPDGWWLYRPGDDGEELEQKYNPPDFEDHPSCQMHKRGTKIWFSYYGEKVLVDVVPCRRLDAYSQKMVQHFFRSPTPKMSENWEILSFCYDTLHMEDEQTKQAHVNNISTSIPEKKMLLALPDSVRKLLMFVKLSCQEAGLISSNPGKPVSDCKGYMDSYIVKTLFIRVILELKARGATDSDLESISPSKFMSYFIHEILAIFQACRSKCYKDVEEYHVRFYHCFISEEHLKRISIKWTKPDFKRLTENCEKLMVAFSDLFDENETLLCSKPFRKEKETSLRGYPSEVWQRHAQHLSLDYPMQPFDYSGTLDSITAKSNPYLAKKDQQMQQLLDMKGKKPSPKTKYSKKKRKSSTKFIQIEAPSHANASVKGDVELTIEKPRKPSYADVLKSRKM